MIGRETKYEMPEISKAQDPNTQVAQKQLAQLAGLVPLEFGSDIFDWLARPEAAFGVAFPDNDPLGDSTLFNMTYPSSIYNYNVLTTSTVRQSVQIEVFAPTTPMTVGDGKKYFHVSNKLTGLNLVEVHAEVITAGITGTTDIQVYNITQAIDMLSTKLTIDSSETGSDTAATPGVINVSNDNVTENDLLRIDLDAVSVNSPLGLLVTLGFE